MDDGLEYLARYRAVRLAETLLWTPYVWGGDDPSGFDCSGLVLEVFKAIGVIDPKVDMTADDLMNRFPPCANGPQDGDLVFWGEGNKATHVEIVWSSLLGLSLGAAGGGRTTLSPADAWSQNAYVRVRPIARGRALVGFRDPYGKWRT